jgi:hypothetical protein
MKIVMLGIDLGKNLCSLAGLDQTGVVVLRHTSSRAVNRNSDGLWCRGGASSG